MKMMTLSDKVDHIKQELNLFLSNDPEQKVTNSMYQVEAGPSLTFNSINEAISKFAQTDMYKTT